MKKTLQTLLLFCGLFAFTSLSAAPVSGVSKADAPTSELSSLSMDDIQDLSIKEVEQMIGKELTLKEKASLKYIQHKLKKSKKGGDDYDPILIYVLCFFIPPLAVFLVYDIGSEFWTNVVLTLLCGLPGVIHAFIICSRKLK